MEYDLKGQVAFITGATSGLGRHFAELLARHGMAVAVTGRRTERLADLVAGIEENGGRAKAIALDVTDASRIAPALDEAEAALGPIDTLVNNAGMSVLGFATEVTPEGFDEVMDTNVRGPFLLATEMARRMIARGKGGRIINMGSMGSFRVLPGLTAYCTSKAAIAMMTQSLAREWARYGINVNALCPGYIETELNSAWFQDEKGKAQIKTFPRRRLAQEADLDGMMLLLASDASRAITGSLLTIDDGQSL